MSHFKQALWEKRTRDNDYISREYRKAAHTGCNLHFCQPKKLPAFFHNLKNYDCSLQMSKLGKFKDYEIEVIVSTLESILHTS